MIIQPVKKLSGEVKLPGDKSISHRAIMLGAIAKGTTRVKGALDCDDCNYTMRAFKDMGVAIKRAGDTTSITGNGLKGLKKPAGPLYAGESGTTMRLMAGILAGQDFESVIEADESLSKRPMKRIVEPLSKMGVDIRARDGEYPPLKIKGGRVEAIDYRMPVASAQVKSAVLFAALYAGGTTSVTEPFKSRDHTERTMKYFGANVISEGLRASVTGGKELTAKELEVPADISSASFFMAGAALLKGSHITIRNVGINPTRAGIIDVMLKMGARIKVSNKIDRYEPAGDIEVEGSELKGIDINEADIPGIIDELPVIFVLASRAKGTTVIKGAGELKVKETDRIRSMKDNLGAMGADISMEGDCVVINGTSELKESSLMSYGDHRTCMAMVIASITAGMKNYIDDTDCVNKSFPGFFKVLGSVTR